MEESCPGFDSISNADESEVLCGRNGMGKKVLFEDDSTGLTLYDDKTLSVTVWDKDIGGDLWPEQVYMSKGSLDKLYLLNNF